MIFPVNFPSQILATPKNNLHIHKLGYRSLELQSLFILAILIKLTECIH